MKAPVFESLRIWHDARHLTSEIYSATREPGFQSDVGLKNQLRRAAISVMSNIAEGKERGGKKEWIHFLRIAKGSVGEVRAQLYAAEDQGYLVRESASMLRQNAAALSREIAVLIRVESERL